VTKLNLYIPVAFFFLVALALISCKPESKTKHKFLFLGHIYDWQTQKGNKVDRRIKKINLSDYEGIWLGGDVCANTSLDPQTMKYLDGLFDLKNPNSHFVLGNHDYRDNNLSAYFAATGRPDYYTSSFKNLVVSVLNTNLNSSDCENLNASCQFFYDRIFVLGRRYERKEQCN